LRYTLPESVRAEIRDRGTTMDVVFQEVTPIRIARTVVAQMTPGTRTEQLEQVARTIEQVQERELASVGKDLAALGIDWSPPPANYQGGPLPSEVSVKLSTDRKNDTVTAGEAMTATVEVTNKGKSPLYQLHAIAKSDTGYYDQKEFVFGKVAPGETKVARAPLGWCKMEGQKLGST